MKSIGEVAVAVSIGLVIGNCVVAIATEDWKRSIDRSIFQIVAIAAYWTCLL